MTFGFLRRPERAPSLQTRTGEVAFRHVRDPGTRGPLLVVLHGYGADASQVASLMPITTDRPSHVVAPEGYLAVRDGGRAWFPIDVREGRPHVDTPHLERALDRLNATLFALHETHCGPSDPVALIGYSQGATLTLEWMSRARTTPVTHAAAFAGTNVSVQTQQQTATALPLFIANGTHDPVISAEQHDATVRRMTALGHAVTARRDPVPHVVSRAALRALAQWLHADPRFRA